MMLIMKPNTPVDEVYEAVKLWQQNCIRALLANQTRNIGPAEGKGAAYSIPQIGDITAVYVNEVMFIELFNYDRQQCVFGWSHTTRNTEYVIFGKPCHRVQDPRHPRVRII